LILRVEDDLAGNTNHSDFKGLWSSSTGSTSWSRPVPKSGTNMPGARGRGITARAQASSCLRSTQSSGS